MPEQQPQLDWPALMEEALTLEGSIGTVYSRFHEYSFANMLLFLSQGIHEPVASRTRWQSLGRHLLRGARGKQVIVPVIVSDKRDQSEREEAAEEPATPSERLIGFKVVRAMFALSDTAGAPLPPVQLPGWDVDTALDRLHIRRVPFRELNGNVQGYSRARDIALNPVAVRPEKTLFHELGHVVLGHTVATTLGEYATHRGTMEFQAEATAYLSLHELGRIDEAAASESRGYIRHWLREEQPRDREIRLVFAATDQILRAGRLAVSHNVDTDEARGRP